MAKALPYLAPDDRGVQSLYIDGKPVMMLAGELHNSSSSSLEYMEQQVWPFLREFHLDTVFLAIPWEMIEPEEGVFTFNLMDGLLRQARREQVKLVLLWFGLWKNGESFYAPGWVKRDYSRFFRACWREASPSETISPLCREAVDADAKAFTRFMRHLKEVDQDEQTVIMVQVENEIGFLGAERDFSAAAQQAFSAPVPKELSDSGQSWADTYGENAPEWFMACHYARAVEVIASAGKADYSLPMYVNAWLEQFPDRPGKYPSGGPIAKVMDIWRKMAPSIDLYAPDIYLPDLAAVCDEYTVQENPLFIPEARRDPVTASNVFYAFGRNAICFSPFAIEDFMKEQYLQIDPLLTQQLNIDWEAFSCQGTGAYLKKSYQLLHHMKELILQTRGTSRLQTFIRRSSNERGCILPLEQCDVQLTYLGGAPSKPGAAGLVIAQSADSFWVAGCNVKISVLPKKGSEELLTIVRLEEGCFVDSAWNPGRVLNGDELTETTLGEFADVRKFTICIHRPC